MKAGHIAGLLGLLIPLMFALAHFSLTLVIGSMYLALVLVWHIIRGRSWLNLFVPAMRRRGALLIGLPVMAVVWLIGIAGYGMAHPTAPTTPKPATLAAPSATPSSSPTPTPDALTLMAQGQAADTLRDLEVREADSGAGFDLASFGAAWIDADTNGCDTQNDVMRRDLADTTIQPGTNGCVVLSGTFSDPYTGTVMAYDSTSPAAVHVDHAVSLVDAWASGASAWTGSQRSAFANDPLNLLLVGSDAAAEKATNGAVRGWLPQNESFHCEYVARQVAVKDKYGLSVTRDEALHLDTTLRTCAQQALPISVLIPLAAEPVPSQAPVVAPQHIVPAPAPKPTTSAPKPVASSAPKPTTSAPKPTTSAPQPAPGKCDIKGNISNKGEKIYHVPGGQFYGATKISASKGERWFCSEAEAVKAGWRKSMR